MSHLIREDARSDLELKIGSFNVFFVGSSLLGCDDAILGLLAADISELHNAFLFKGSLVYEDETDGRMFVRNVGEH